ncbi:MAG: orotidine-5'-phosphate decarboxylase [Zoogloeaceae bacterium]|jgi:orotidine-5'-phosphate decarboxylase|nr:orotidine-5'-phosphate decarboxylase [Zoogloeaceae bacterium]
MRFTEMLSAAWQKNDSLLCVGLDPDPDRFPVSVRKSPDALFEFCAAIIDATAHLVCAFKPQIAYFSACRGEETLERVIAYIHARHPGIPVILDAKRGDIGPTAKQYAREAFARYQADAVTLNPYMGFDSIEPYFEYPKKGVILLCRTSNPGGSDLQFMESREGEMLFERVARLAAEAWNQTGQCALVVGATFPIEIARVRAIVGDMPLLVPGIGTQGGDIAATVKAGKTGDGRGLILNSSRAILYAGQGEDYATAAQEAARQTRDAINRER